MPTSRQVSGTAGRILEDHREEEGSDPECDGAIQDSQDHGDAREAGFEVGPNPTEPSVEDQRHHEEEPETDNEREAEEARADERLDAEGLPELCPPYDVQVLFEP